MFTDCGYRNLCIKCLVIVSLIYVYAFVEKQSCAFIIYIYPGVSAYAFVKSRLCNLFTVHCSRFCIISGNGPLLGEYRTTGWLECYVNKSAIKSVFCYRFPSPLQN